VRLPTATALEPPSCIRAVSCEVVAAIRCFALALARLTRIAIEFPGLIGRCWAVTVPLALLIGSLMFTPRHMCWGASKVDIGKLTVRKFADEAYPQWAAAHPDRVCPVSLDELSTYMDKKDTKDPWGVQYRFRCVDGHVVVWSFGEDGKANTGDDIRSDSL